MKKRKKQDKAVDMATRLQMPEQVEMRISVGDKMQCKTAHGLGEGLAYKSCTVVYIHPRLRFYTVRFDCLHGSYCESYRWGYTE